VLQSVSRLIGEIVSEDVVRAGQRVRSALAALREKEDLIAIGAYSSGSDPALDAALAHRPRIDAFLRQATGERAEPRGSDAQLLELAESLERTLQSHHSEVIDGEEVPAHEPQPAPAATTETGPSAIPALHLSV
jgi:flagellum-specific ATP synthase